MGFAALTLLAGTASGNPVAVDQSIEVAEGAVRHRLILDINGYFAPSLSTFTVSVLPSDLTLEIRRWDSGAGAYVFNPVVSGAENPIGDRLNVYVSGPSGVTGARAFQWFWTLKENDSETPSNVATCTLSVLPNTVPVAADRSFSFSWVSEYRAGSGMPVTDPDANKGQAIVRTVLSLPDQGVLLIHDGTEYVAAETNSTTLSQTVLYRPNLGFAGTDSFVWIAHDGIDTSNEAACEFVVSPPTLPEVFDTRTVLVRDEPVVFRPRFWDPDLQNEHAFVLLSAPTNGVLEYQSGWNTWQPLPVGEAHDCLYNHRVRWRYTPASGFTGEDAYTWKMLDAADLETDVAQAAILVRDADDRSGMLVNIVVNALLLPEIETEIDRLKDDLENEGYTALVSPLSGSPSAADLWQHLAALHESQWMAGAILIGNLPRTTARAYGTGKSMQSTDKAFWCMSRMGWVDYLYDGNGGIVPERPLDIWVSRMWATAGNGSDLTYGPETLLLKRALDVNHYTRTGQHRLPHAAFWNDCFDESQVATRLTRLREIWPEASRQNNSIAWRSGGDLLHETQHGNTTRYQGGGGPDITRDSIHRLSGQIRFALNSSCSSGALGGVVNNQLLTRGGGNVLSVGASATTFWGAFDITDNHPAEGDDTALRARLAAGDTWGAALTAHYGFGDNRRAYFYGDLSMPAMPAPHNERPTVVTLTATPSSGTIPLTVEFAATATDADGSIVKTEWFFDGHNLGRNEPTLTVEGAPDVQTRVFEAPGTYLVRVEVVDDYMARDWKEVSVTVNSPPPTVLHASPATPLFMDAGETCAFAMEAVAHTGEVTYVWRLNGALLAGAVASQLEWTAPAGYARAHVLEATATDIWGSTVSHAWTVHVEDVPVPAGPVGYWRLDEDSGMRADSSGFGNDLTENGTVASTNGMVSGAARFGGANHLFIADADQQNLNAHDSLTLAAWIRPETVGDRRMIMSKYNFGNNQRAYRFGLNAGKLSANLAEVGSSNEEVNGNATLVANQWAHAAMVFDAGQVRFYLDGVLDKEAAVSFSRLFASTAPFALGANYNTSPTQFFQGRIDEARVFMRALSQAEIQALMEVASRKPYAMDDQAVTRMNQPVWIDVLANDGDPDGGAVTLTDAGSAAQGAVTTTDDPAGALYTPNAGFTGVDTFSYTIRNEGEATATGTVRVLVVGEIPMTLAPNSAGMSFSFEAVSNWKYRVEYKNDLVRDEHWLELCRGVAASDETVEITDEDPPSQRFYRIGVRP